MLLTLEVVSSNGASLGADRKRVVGPEGIQIGRSKENDWVIPDEFISRKHASVRYVNGAFYLEGLGRNPIAINGPDNVVENHEPVLLRNGDRFFVDQYEFRVTLGTGAPQRSAIPEDPFASPEIDAFDGGGVGVPELDSTENLDPLAALGGPVKRPPAKPSHVELNQTPLLEESYRPPQIVQPPQGPRIPEAWDRSHIEPVSPSNRTASLEMDPFAEAPPPRSARPSPPSSEVRRNPPPAKSASPKVPQRRPSSAGAPQTVRREEPQSDASASPTLQARALKADAPSAGEASASLDRLLRAAGVQGAMSPEIAQELGEVFQVVVQGLMDVLQSRAEIKSQLRMTLTRIESSENNPLKFSPNVEAALHTLFVERNRGYLGTRRAFEEAFLDIRNHQLALLQGMRVAFEHMLEQFDPERIDSELEEQSKGPLLSLGAKGRFRDYYVSRFERLTRDKTDAFEELFGDKFAHAYEQQLARLKSSRKAQP